MSNKVETVVIGAGVIGLAVARALSIIGHEVLIVDRAGYIGSETSSRNSEVIHGGLYYPFNTFKAKFCVTGRQQMYEYCKIRNIYTNRCGKLIVANTKQQIDIILKDIQQNAQQNNVYDTILLTEEDVKVIEPEIQCRGALYSPSTGIVDSHHFMLNLLADAEHYTSTTLALHTTVEDATIIGVGGNDGDDEKKNSDQVLKIYADGIWLSCKNVINCAGLWANEIATMFHKSNDKNNKNTTGWKPPPLYFAKGTYFKLQGRKQPNFSHLIYPVPDIKGGLGVHSTIDPAGQIKFGPDVEWLDPETISKADLIDMKPNADRAASFYSAIRSYWPELQDDTLIPDYTGIRPKLTHPNLYQPGEVIPFQDFMIVGPKTHKIKGLIHLFGIESPGLTSSMAIAEYVVKLLHDE